MLRKIFLCFLAMLGTILSLTSCKNTTQLYEDDNPLDAVVNESDIDKIIDTYFLTGSLLQYHNGYIYLHNGLFVNATMTGGRGTLVRYNPETENITTLCADPLCMHDTAECPFAGSIYFFYMKDNSIIYMRRYYVWGEGDYVQYCTYDVENMKLKVHHEYLDENDSYSAAPTSVLHNGFWYFHEMVYDEETDSSGWGVHRLNLKSGKMDVILMDDHENSVEDKINNQLLFAIEDRLYFSDLKSIYSTNQDLTDKTVHIEADFAEMDAVTDGTYVYASIPEYDEQGKWTERSRLHRFSLATGEDTDLGIEAADWVLTEQYIYYYPSIQRLYLYDSTPDEAEVPFAAYDSLWRCRHDGSEAEKVLDLYRYDETTGKITTAISLQYYTIAGDTLYARYKLWEDKDGSGSKTTGDVFYDGTFSKSECRILKLNLTDGTYEVIQIR